MHLGSTPLWQAVSDARAARYTFKRDFKTKHLGLKVTKKTDRMKRVKSTTSFAPETDYEIRRLAKLWAVPISQAWARCCHYIGARVGKSDGDQYEHVAAVRQAEAKVEMLKAKR